MYLYLDADLGFALGPVDREDFPLVFDTFPPEALLKTLPISCSALPSMIADVLGRGFMLVGADVLEVAMLVGATVSPACLSV